MARWVSVEERLPEPDPYWEHDVILNGELRRGTFDKDSPLHPEGRWYVFGVAKPVTYWLDPHPLPGEEEKGDG